MHETRREKTADKADEIHATPHGATKIPPENQRSVIERAERGPLVWRAQIVTEREGEHRRPSCALELAR